MQLAALSDISLADSRGQTHRLGDLWRDQPVVLVFLRHFGCLHCREHVAQLRDQRDDIQALGADIVAIGTGDRAYAEAFVRDTGITFPVLLDDRAEAANAAAVPTASWFGL